MLDGRDGGTEGVEVDAGGVEGADGRTEVGADGGEDGGGVDGGSDVVGAGTELLVELDVGEVVVVVGGVVVVVDDGASVVVVVQCGWRG